MLPSLDHRIALATDASDDAPFTISSPKCIVLGRERSGIWEVLIKGVLVARDFEIANAVATTFRLSPLGAERVLRVGDVVVVERIVAAPEAPAVAVEWSVDRATQLRVRWAAPEREVASFTFSRPVEIKDGVALLLLSAGESIQLVMTTDMSGDADEDAAAWVKTHAAEADRRDREWLAVEFSENDLTTAFEWAKFRLATTHRVESPRPPVALVGVGDFRRAREHLDTLAPALDYMFLLSRYFAATGDDAFVRASWPYVHQLYEQIAIRIDADMVRDLADTAETLGDKAFATELLHASRGRPIGDLPWQDFADGRTRNGIRQWLSTARACFAFEHGAWPENAQASAAGVIASFVYGLLGYAPDAAHGRLRLRPQIPLDWPRLTVRNIRVGDAFVTLEYTREGNVCKFEVSQTAGAVPVRLILEPALPATISRAFVDSKPAELDAVTFGERVIAPVQIMLDNPRMLETQLRI